MTTTAEEPSLMLDEFPAVRTPVSLKTGFSFARPSSVESSLGPSSTENSIFSFLDGSSTVRISFLKAPDFPAATAFWWLQSANLSASSLVTPFLSATISPVLPMWKLLYTSHRPSLPIESTIVASHSLYPNLAFSSRYGALVMLSMPPATTTLSLPARIASDASMTAFRPEPQTLFMVRAATSSDSPPQSAACLAGFCPSPAGKTFPMMHSSTSLGSIPALRTASLTATDPSLVALISLSAPPNFPTAVLVALMMTASFIVNHTPSTGRTNVLMFEFMKRLSVFIDCLCSPSTFAEVACEDGRAGRQG